MNSTTIEPLLLTAREAAKALSVCERTLFSLSKAGELRTVRVGRAVRYPVAELQKWIEKKSLQNS